MKNKIIYIALFSAFAFINASAQDQTTKGFLSMGGGISMLNGNITKTDYEDLSSGFAKSSGGVFSFDGAYFFKKNFGAGLNISFGRYAMNGYEKLAEGAYEAYEIEEAAITPGHYSYVNFLPAFYYTTGGEKFAFDARILLGYQNLTTPEIVIGLEENEIVQKSASGGGFAYGIGVAGRFNFSKSWGLHVGIDYISSKPNITIENEGINNTFETLRVVDKYNESIGMINATLGICYSFGSK